MVIGIAVVVIVLLLFYKKWVNRENKKLYESGGKHSLKSQLLYSYRTIYHPFDGFWDLKHEKRGNIKSASIIAVLFFLLYILRMQFGGYAITGDVSEDVNIFYNFFIINFFIFK